MNLLTGLGWQTKYSREHGDLLKGFYVPALMCAIRYDRSTGYFSADALGRLAWMVARGHLDVKVAVPCDGKRRPIAEAGLFHEKAGIIEDVQGNPLAFSGSINEAEFGRRHNWESFHVYTTWTGGTAHVEAEEESFQRLWADKAATAIVMDVPAAVRQELLKFLPKDDLPSRLKTVEEKTEHQTKSPPEIPKPESPPEPALDRRRLVWGFIPHAPSWPNGGERIGEATSAVTPWPHQVRAFQRLYDRWPPRLLIADEVGLGKTIQAGMLLCQAWLSGRAKRILVLATKAVLSQWQIELREKFNLNWPIYDGQRLSWYPSPGFQGAVQRAIGPDQLLRLMQGLRDRVQGLAALFRAAEQVYRSLPDAEAARLLPGVSRLKVRKILRALRDQASIPLKQLETVERQAAIRLMKANTPLRRLISRHTRELLRRYHKAGKLETPIADRAWRTASLR